MKKKSNRIETLLAGLGNGPGGDGVAHEPRYVGWFTCFNSGEYYEAHDVLENLWLQTQGADHAFFKGLIQVAGAFVHLRKQFERPQHAKDGVRLRPARHLAPYRPFHHRLDVASVCALCEAHIAAIEASAFTRNPWEPARAPRIELTA
ncbi:MAG: DUF309 domain-containing protein [Chthoniobacteraceae bacterium]